MVYKKGSKGEIVKKIQKVLNLYPDGIFGILTEEAVKEFQKTHGLTADGIVGAATLAKLGITAIQQSTGLKKSKRVITEIIVHCSATPAGCHYTVDDIRRWHKQQGWSDVGYHYIVYIDGTVVKGRDVDLVGAHCAKGGHNQHSIGVCYIGGVDNKPNVPAYRQPAKDTRTTKQKESLLKLLKDLKQLYPKAKIYGHRDFDSSKACPSFDAKKEYATI